MGEKSRSPGCIAIDIHKWVLALTPLRMLTNRGTPRLQMNTSAIPFAAARAAQTSTLNPDPSTRLTTVIRYGR